MFEPPWIGLNQFRLLHSPNICLQCRTLRNRITDDNFSDSYSTEQYTCFSYQYFVWPTGLMNEWLTTGWFCRASQIWAVTLPGLQYVPIIDILPIECRGTFRTAEETQEGCNCSAVLVFLASALCICVFMCCSGLTILPSFLLITGTPCALYMC